MALHASVKQGNRGAKQIDRSHRRQPLGLVTVKIDDHPYDGALLEFRAKDAEAARLDPPSDRRWATRDKNAIPRRDDRPVIGDEHRAMCHQLQRQCRLAAAGSAPDQRRDGSQSDAACMKDRLAGFRHIGRPTTNRAPRGSEVRSASVGRIFSAQMTPPCASTICLDIASPRPELLPNCPAGRSE